MALKVHKGVEIELRSIGIWNNDVLMLPRSQRMHVCCKYYSDLTMHAYRFVAKACMVEMLQFKATVWPKIAPKSIDLGSSKIPKFSGGASSSCWGTRPSVPQLGMGLCQYVDLCFHASSLPCFHTFWHTIPTSFYIFNVSFF